MTVGGTISKQIRSGSEKAGKTYGYNDTHNPSSPAQMWFQHSPEGLVLFVVFYTQACRWSRCIGCNLPSQVSQAHVPYQRLMEQIDHLFADVRVHNRCRDIEKIIISNNGSVLDEDTFSSTALMYLIARVNQFLPRLKVLSMESRPEYVDLEELEFLSRALAEGHTPTQLEIAVGFEAFDDHIRNDLFDKGLSLKAFEQLVAKMAPYRFALKCYFMQKPVPGISDDEAVADIQNAIAYLDRLAARHHIPINMHLNPTYAAYGTALERAFNQGKYHPPRLGDVAQAVLYARDRAISVFIGLSDEGLAVPGGSFITSENRPMVQVLEEFNRTQDYDLLAELCTG
jgi:radical SAM enzyme (TIGR01210 family)